MKTKITVILISILVALMLISNGYGVWNKSLRIEGDIRVVPELDVLEAMESQLDDLEKQLDEEIMSEQNLDEEQLQPQIEENNLRVDSNLNSGVIAEKLKPVDEIATKTDKSLIDDKEENQKEWGGIINKETKGEKDNSAKDDDNNSGLRLEKDINGGVGEETGNTVKNDNGDIESEPEENTNEKMKGKADNIAGSGNDKAELNESGYESDNNSEKLGGGGYEGSN